MIKDLVTKNRSCRRFYQEKKIEEQTLRQLVNLARLSASAGNLQSLKYILSCDAEKNDAIFQHLRWAAYLTHWPGPDEGERPAAYIVILGDTKISKNFYCDHGIAAQSILLGAVEKGLGGCIFASIDREALRKTLNIDKHLEILLVIALGVPKEKVVLEEVADDGNIKYWRSSDGTHHVPKRKLDNIILDY